MPFRNRRNWIQVLIEELPGRSLLFFHSGEWGWIPSFVAALTDSPSLPVKKEAVHNEREEATSVVLLVMTPPTPKDVLKDENPSLQCILWTEKQGL